MRLKWNKKKRPDCDIWTKNSEINEINLFCKKLQIVPEGFQEDNSRSCFEQLRHQEDLLEEIMNLLY